MMPLRVVQDKREIYESYNDALREQATLSITIDGASDREQLVIQNGIQELFTAEMIRLVHDHMRINGVPDEFLGESRLRSSLDGVSLPERDLRILEAKIRQLAMRMRQIEDGDVGTDPGEDEERPNRDIKWSSHNDWRSASPKERLRLCEYQMICP